MSAATTSGPADPDGGGAFAAAIAMPARLWPERRSVVLGTALALFVATFVLREIVAPDREDVLGLLYVIPVALVGLELGLRAGAASAAGILLLVALYRVPGSPSLDAVGIITRAVALLSVGALAGRFSDSMHSFQERQARLFAVERESAALARELHTMQRRLQDQFRNAGHVLDIHEQERRGIAEQLHEQAAQAMCAALLVVGRLESDIVDELTQAQLQRVRHSVNECIAEIRRLAGSLRCPVLEELGLRPALERLIEREREANVRTIDLRGLADLPQLPADVEIAAYRVIEDVTSAIGGPLGIHIALDAPSESMEIVIESGADVVWDMREPDAALITTRARLEMVGGSLSVSATPEGVLVAAAIPLGVSVESDAEYAQGSSRAA